MRAETHGGKENICGKLNKVTSNATWRAVISEDDLSDMQSRNLKTAVPEM